ncbi:MAG: substrate-binding domain-containing protein [Candidatus Methylacidiphilales bacterium]|nr:substrate-binding domain-containing protein [Candidatus Methylacidiphilales bacterium]
MEAGQTESGSVSASLKDRVYLVLRTLIRSSYFGEQLPPITKLVQMTRIPKSAVEEALLRLENEDLLEKHGASYKSIYIPEESLGRVAFLLNTNLFASWYGIFQDYLIGAEETLRAAGYDFLFRGDFASYEDKHELIREFHENGIRGIIFASFAEPKLRQYVLDHRIPSVILGNATIHQEELACVSSDNVGGIKKAVKLLVENGHRNIAYYTASATAHDGFEERLVGYELAMRAAHLQVQYDLVLQERHSSGLARKAATLFTAMRPRPTAIVCSCDREAFELIAELRQSNISVPEDVSVVGYGNSIFGTLSEPPLTTIEIFARDLGKIGANFLINEMVSSQVPIRMTLPTELVVRESVLGLEQSTDASGGSDAPTPHTTRIDLPDSEEIGA